MSFIKEDFDRSRIPVVIVSGFLGSGKTTLINRILKDPRLARTAVAINEFGEIPIDQNLIDHGEDQTIVMANGCLCCNLAGDMEQAIMRLFSRRGDGEIPHFDRLIIEPSGLADPAPIAQAIIRHPILASSFTLLALIALADAVLAHEQIVRFAEVRKQFSLADSIIISKMDLVSSSAVLQLREELLRVNPYAQVHEISSSHVDCGLIFSERFLDPKASPSLGELIQNSSHNESRYDRHPLPSPMHLQKSGITSVSVTTEARLPWRALDEWLRMVRIGNGEKILRIKGICRVAGNSKPLVIQAVEHVQSVPVELEQWPSGEQKTVIVLIGIGINRNHIIASWKTMCENYLVGSANDPDCA